MRLISFERQGRAALGIRIGDEAVDVAAADPALSSSLSEVLAGGADAMTRLRSVADKGPRLPLSGLRLLPPVTSPGKIICLGLNYRGHAKETGHEIPVFPVMFLRTVSSLVAHGQPIVRPTVSDLLDYEGEMVAVVGSRCRHVKREDALSKIAGYSVFNDASIRDYQMRTHQWTIGKIFDGTGAFGPELITSDELPPGASGLRLSTRLNGETLQDSRTDDLIFDVATLVETLSQCMTLEPGDLIVTGTPAGVGGMRKPQIFMKPGDICEVEIEGIGTLSNPIVQEADPAEGG